MSNAPFSVIIPAHNEEDVIGRCLHAVYDGAPPDRLPEVIVAANGCQDRTAQIARQIAPQATVLELPAGSKAMAMNEGSRIATATPRFFLDADVQCNYRSLAATAEVLGESGVMAASPRLRMDLSRSDALVRAHYRVWLTQPYARDRLVGSGLYGLSETGLKALGAFPKIFGDDIWVHSRFPYDQRRNIDTDRDGNPVYFVVSPPRKWSDLVRIEARRRVGDAQAYALHPGARTSRRDRMQNLRSALSTGASPVDVAIYLGLKSAAQARYRWNRFLGKTPVWTRDLNARKPA
ncbi:MAG: glycosyltransferase [Novosphingobium sp.]